MFEIQSDKNIFTRPDKPYGQACVVTTNGVIRKDGKAVMGAGIAKYCRDTFAGVDSILGRKLKEYPGNHAHYLGSWSTHPNQPLFLLFSFPTKDDWRDDSKPELIRRSCQEVMKLADDYKIETVYMPCPGCKNGRLNYWRDVRQILHEELDNRFIVCVPNAIMKMRP